MNNHICHSCSKRSSCDFAKDLDRALNGLGSMVSENIRAQICELVASDVVACSDYNQDEAVKPSTPESNGDTYYVTHRLSARFVSEVNAGSIAEAIAMANDKFSEADFGSAEDIDGEAVNVQDANGNFLWEG